MIKIISKKKYNEMIIKLKELELCQEAENDGKIYAWVLLDEEKEKVKKYKKLYADELQKRLELAEMVMRLENERK